MAKKKIVHPIHMHVPTTIGFTVIAIAVMVYGLFLASASVSNNQPQSVQSDASYCPVKKPACGSTNKLVCQGGYWRCVPKPSPTVRPMRTPTPAPTRIPTKSPKR